MAYKHRPKRKSRPAGSKNALENPVQGSAMDTLRQQTAVIDNNRENHGFMPKPKAIRKYERYANMGE